MSIFSYIVALFLLSVIVFVHELGHFLVARWFGITVEIFSIGFGPEMIGFTKGKTRYRLSWIPFGGYCKLKGELQETTPDSLYGKPAWIRILVLFAGAGFNILFALFTMSFLYFVGYKEIVPSRVVDVLPTIKGKSSPAWESGLRPGCEILAINHQPVLTYNDILEHISLHANKPLSLVYRIDHHTNQTTVTPLLSSSSGLGEIGILPVYRVVIGGVLSNSPAFYSGLQPGDIIIAVDGKPTSFYYEFRYAIQDKALMPVSFTFVRKNSTNTLTITLDKVEEKGFLGISLAGSLAFPITNTVKSQNLLFALKKGSTELWKQFLFTIKGFSRMFEGNLGVSQNLYGPIRIVRETALITQWLEFSLLIRFIAIISLGLGVANLLPIPGLDGGHILINTLEWISRRKLPDHIRIALENIGILVLLLLGTWILSNDISHIFYRR
ncbi:MAG: RIP metalloprotease RseP [Brevinematales bacterium]|nr:RIP metalloprotease RseP [Brevinematales bacterium]